MKETFPFVSKREQLDGGKTDHVDGLDLALMMTVDARAKRNLKSESRVASLSLRINQYTTVLGRSTLTLVYVENWVRFALLSFLFLFVVVCLLVGCGLEGRFPSY